MLKKYAIELWTQDGKLYNYDFTWANNEKEAIENFSRWLYQDKKLIVKVIKEITQ